jgi:Flp pilus assembly protein protease CpaA
MIEIIFLIVLALIWIFFAVANDWKTRIVPDWLNFSLIIFALGFRFFFSLFDGDFNFLYQGIFGLGIFFVLGNIFYYSKMFAGGDAKLMIALGAVLGFYNSFTENAFFFFYFILLFLFVGAIYGFGWSAYLTVKNFSGVKKQFRKLFMENKNVYLLFTFFSIILALFGFFADSLLLLSAILIFFFPWLYIYAKAVDEACLIKNVKSKDLEEGDWLYHDLKIGNKKIKSKWEGLSREEINFIKKKVKEIKIRQGIPFTPVFLFSFVALVFVYFMELGFFKALF